MHDCFDVADYLFENAAERFGGPLQFIGGEVRMTLLCQRSGFFLDVRSTNFENSNRLVCWWLPYYADLLAFGGSP